MLDLIWCPIIYATYHPISLIFVKKGVDASTLENTWNFWKYSKIIVKPTIHYENSYLENSYMIISVENEILDM